MPSLPDLPAKNDALIDSTATNALYTKATREYVNRNFAASLETIALLRSQQTTTLKTRRRIFFLYLTVVDAICNLDEVQLNSALGRNGLTVAGLLKSSTIWTEAETYFAGTIPIDVSVHIILALSRHVEDPAQLQGRVEELLTSLDPDSSEYDSISELYALHVLPRSQEWDSASGFIESMDVSDEKKTTWQDTLVQIQDAQEAQKVQAQKELDDAKAAELEEKKLRKIRKSKTSSKKSSASQNGSHQGGTTNIPGTKSVLSDDHEVEDNLTSLTVPERDVTAVSTIQRWSKALFAVHYNTQVVRLLLFLALLFGATGRRAVRERIQRALSKIGQTITAGFKTTYI